MFGSAVLEVAIGLALVYLVLALICSTVTESVAGAFQLRSKTLAKGIASLLDEGSPAGAKIAQEFLSHSLIKKISDKGRLPSYIPPQLFARVLVDIISPGQAGRSATEAEIADAVDKMDRPHSGAGADRAPARQHGVRGEQRDFRNGGRHGCRQHSASRCRQQWRGDSAGAAGRHGT